MAPEELRDACRQKPFEPFRLVMTDGEGYDIRHPDLLCVVRRTAYVGLTGQPGQTFFERAVTVDLLHVSRIDPLDSSLATDRPIFISNFDNGLTLRCGVR